MTTTPPASAPPTTATEVAQLIAVASDVSLTIDQRRSALMLLADLPVEDADPDVRALMAPLSDFLLSFGPSLRAVWAPKTLAVALQLVTGRRQYPKHIARALDTALATEDRLAAIQLIYTIAERLAPLDLTDEIRFSLIAGRSAEALLDLANVKVDRSHLLLSSIGHVWG